MKDMVEENVKATGSKSGKLVLYSEFDRKPVKLRHERSDMILFWFLENKSCCIILDFLKAKELFKWQTSKNIITVVKAAQDEGWGKLNSGAFSLNEQWPDRSNFSQLRVGSFAKMGDILMRQQGRVKMYPKLFYGIVELNFIRTSCHTSVTSQSQSVLQARMQHLSFAVIWHSEILR